VPLAARLRTALVTLLRPHAVLPSPPEPPAVPLLPRSAP
jgi:hypothetical protein